MKKTLSYAVIFIVSAIFFIPIGVKGQVIVETFEETAWTTATQLTNTSSQTLSYNIASSTSTNQTISTNTGNSSSNTVTTTTNAQQSSGNWTWAYSKASIFTATNSASRIHSQKKSFAMSGSSSFLITPIISGGISSLSFWAILTSSSSSGGFIVGINTNTALAYPTTGSVCTSGTNSTLNTDWLFNSSTFSITNGLASFSYSYTGTYTGDVRVALFNFTAQTCMIDDIVIFPASATLPNPSAVSFTTPSTACQTDRLTISWTGPSGYSGTNNTILAFLKQGSGITIGTPTYAPSYYTASTAYSGGTAYQGDAGAYCIYNGDGTDGAGGHSGLTVTGLSANTTYYLLLFNVLDGGPTYSTGVSSNGTTLNVLAEPSNQPTAFVQGAVTTSAIPLSWTAATGSQLPDGYLVQASASATPAEPVDGTDMSSQSNISGGTANVKVAGTSSNTITGYTAGTMYYFRINSYTNSNVCIDYKNASSSTPVAGPSINVATLPNVATGLGLSISSGTGSISWAAASGYSNANHTTLVFVKAGSAITIGTPTADPSGYTANSALGSGTAYLGDAAAYCVYNGDGTSASVTGLSAGTTYYVLILTVMSAGNSDGTYSYSSAATINAATPAEYTWVGGSSGSWATASNWSPSRATVQSTDVLTINNPSSVTCTSVPATETIAKLTVNSNCAVTLQSSSSSVLTITSNNGSADDLVVSSGSSLTLGSSVNITLGSSTTANVSGILTVNSGRTYNTDASGAVTNLSGTIVNSGTVTSTNSSRLVANSGGIYKHNVNGGTIPTGTWNTGSVCWITGITSATNFNGHRQTFSVFIWDCGSQTADPFVLGQNSDVDPPNFKVTDTLFIYRTNGKKLQLTSTGGQRDITVGNYFQYGGKVAISYNTDAGGDQRSLTVNNTFYLADSIEANADFQLINQPAAQNVTGRLYVKGDVNMHKSITNGYLSNVSSSSKGEIIFNGTVNQYVKFDKTSGRADFITNNTGGGVYLQSDVTTYRFKLVNGSFYIGSNTLTIGGPVSYPSPGNGLFAGSATSNLTIGSPVYSKNDSVNVLKFASGYQLLKNFSLSDTANAVLGSRLALTAGSGCGKLILDTASTLTTSDSLTFQSDANGTARIDMVPVNGSGVAKATVAGKVTIERYLPLLTPYTSRRWRLLTAPVSSNNAPTINASWQEGATSTNRLSPVNPNPGYGTPITRSTVSADGYDQGSTNNPSIYYTNPGSGIWSVPAATNSGKITDNTGNYMVFIRGDRSIVVSNQYINTSGGVNLRVCGEPNMGTISKATVAGVQVLGNPYISAISFNNVSYNGATPGSTIGSTFYLWDPRLLGSKGVGKWVTFSSNGTNKYTTVPKPVDSGYMSQYTNTGLIESGAAFSINAASAGTFVFHESDKIDSSKTIGLSSRPAPSQRPQDEGELPGDENDGILYTNLAYRNGSEAILADGVATIYGDRYFNDIDEQDVLKLQTFSTKERIDLVRGDNKLSIERRKCITINDTIYFNTNLDYNYPYQLQFIGINFDKKLNAILEDTYLNTATNINTDGIDRYNFTTDGTAASVAGGRFRIVFRLNTPLPVRFINVSAYPAVTGNIISWTVGDMLNVNTYQIQHSADGLHFTTIGSLAATEATQYVWTDSSLSPGISFYRIMSIGKNGEVSYSAVVKVITPQTSCMELVPVNGQQNTWLLSLNEMPAGTYQLRWLNVAGQLLADSGIMHVGGTRSYPLSIPGKYAGGICLLQVYGPGSQTISFRVAISH